MPDLSSSGEIRHIVIGKRNNGDCLCDKQTAFQLLFLPELIIDLHIL
jgi:hypothetical protein